MIPLDYFLYDNRTWAPRIGRDWGIKAATGMLASRSDLRSSFERYCGALPGDQGQLSGFDQALGGVHPRSGNGYLLCVTLETSDPFGRPSWAVYGLWCPDVESLDRALAADPVGAARAILRADTPPPVIELTSVARSLPAPRRLAAERAFRRFDRRSSISEVLSLLLGAIRRRAALPDILGVTASSRLSALGQQFNVVYCHPLDDRAERAFSLHRSGDELIEVVVESVVSPSRQPTRGTSWAWALGILAAIAIALLIIRPQWLVLADARAERPPVQSKPRVHLRVNVYPTDDSWRQLQTRLEELEALDPEELRIAARSSRGRIRKTYSALIEHRERIVGSGSDAPVRSPDAATRLRQVRSILDERVLGNDVCGRDGNSDSLIQRWCESFAKLERTVQSLPEPPSLPSTPPPGSMLQGGLLP